MNLAFPKKFFSLLLAGTYLVTLTLTLFVNPPKAYAATSPTLGNAASFAVLAGTAITNVPSTTITGDVGLSPAAGSNYSGLGSGSVSGTIFAVDATGPAGSVGNNPTLLTSAKNDLITAYDGLAAGANAACNNIFDATIDTGLGPVDLVGKTLPPDVYCADSFALSGR